MGQGFRDRDGRRPDVCDRSQGHYEATTSRPGPEQAKKEDKGMMKNIGLFYDFLLPFMGVGFFGFIGAAFASVMTLLPWFCAAPIGFVIGCALIILIERYK